MSLAFFTHVVLLDEKMHQHDDIAYCSLLRSLHMVHTTMNGYMTLIGKVRDSISTAIPAGGSDAKVQINFANTYTLSLLFSLHNSGNNQPIFL